MDYRKNFSTLLFVRSFITVLGAVYRECQQRSEHNHSDKSANMPLKRGVNRVPWWRFDSYLSVVESHQEIETVVVH